MTRLAELGVWGALVPAEYGGLGLDLVTAIMMVEEVARGWGMLGALLASHLAAADAIARHATPAVRERLLPSMVRAERLGCVALGGPAPVRRVGGGWGLLGGAPFTAGAGHAAVFVIVGELEGRRAAFLAEAGAAGLEVGSPAATLGFHGLGVADITFAHLRLPHEARLGHDDGAAAETAAGLESRLRLGEAAVAVGLGEAALEGALRYAQQRHTFGKPIAQHQAIQLKLADMATRVTAARLLVHRGGRAPGRAPRRRRPRGDGAAGGRGDGLSRRARVDADARRLRLHQGIPHRAALPRCRRAPRRRWGDRPAAPRGGAGRAGGCARVSYGRYFEEFTVGQEFRHWPGRTITEADCTWFALLTMNQHPLHSDAHYAETHTQHKQRVVLGPLVYSVVIGMTVADISGRAIANLQVDALRHEKPTFIGDTLYAHSRVLELRESRQGDRGIVTVETRATNQRGEQVCTYTRKVLVPKKNHPTLGEGRLPY